ncbi:MAG TPA: outer membrane lipoprotein carrier protein LolA, partial [Polyangiaceae bacterium]
MKKAAAVAFVLALFGGITMTPGQSLAQAPAAGAQAAPPDAPTVVANVQAFYDKTSSFSSTFAQVYVVKAYNVTKTSAGSVVFLKPGKMDWTYTDPTGNRIVSDGSILRVYEAANKQMYEQSVNQSQYPAALAFLTGQGKLATLFNFQLLPGAQ